MFKIISKYIDNALLKSCFSFALIYFFMFNSPVIYYKFTHLNTGFGHKFFELIKDFFFINLMLFIFFLGLTIHRYLFICISFIFFLSGALASYVLFMDGYFPASGAISSVFDLNYLFDGVNIQLIAWLIFAIGIWAYSISYFKIETDKTFASKLMAAICLLLLVNSVISPSFKFMRQYFPLQYMHKSYQYYLGNDPYSGHIKWS